MGFHGQVMPKQMAVYRGGDAKKPTGNWRRTFAWIKWRAQARKRPRGGTSTGDRRRGSPGGSGRGAPEERETGLYEERVVSLRSKEPFCGVILNFPKTPTVSQPLEYKQYKLWGGWGPSARVDRLEGRGASMWTYISLLSRLALTCEEQAGTPDKAWNICQLNTSHLNP